MCKPEDSEGKSAKSLAGAGLRYFVAPIFRRRERFQNISGVLRRKIFPIFLFREFAFCLFPFCDFWIFSILDFRFFAKKNSSARSLAPRYMVHTTCAYRP
jgi:hypothetical protein